ADNASSSRVVFGTTLKRPDELELDLVGVTLSINGELKEMGAGAAVLGHPANSVAMLANMLARKGLKLKAGQTILTGGITGAVMLQPGDAVSARLDGLGSVGFLVRA
ncbi:fumarylacetoacetate hydrolase family protein, partial [Anoxybacillus sp. LAT_38]|nr:fumarylacetoacetate hydrolase family protein [Anoxybacillus sp. LAT_38]